MGVIQRQSIKYSIINLFGALIGGFSMLFIYSQDKDLYGFAQMLLSISYLLLPFATYGIGSVVVRFYREFKTEDGSNNGFLSLILLVFSLSVIIFLLLFSLLKSYVYQLVDYVGMNSQMLKDNEGLILTLLILLGIIGWLIPYISNFRRIVFPSLISELGFKIFLPTSFLLCLYEIIDRNQFGWNIPIFYILVVLLLIVYLNRLRGLKLDWKPTFYKKKKRSIRSYFVFSSLTSLGSQLTNRLDTVMIPLILGYSSNGLYAIVYFMSNVISIPTNSIYKISNPIISESIEQGDYNHVEEVYKKSSSNLFLVGVYLYISMIVCLPYLFQLSQDPSAFDGAMIVFYFLGFGKLIDMLTSVNGAIISYSKYYRYNLIFILILGIANIFLNYYLINEYLIKGAAIATVLALVLFNIMKVVFIYYKFRIHPFTQSNLKTLIVFSIIFIFVNWLNIDISPIFNLMIYGSIITFLAIILSFKLKISNELNHLLIDKVPFLKK